MTARSGIVTVAWLIAMVVSLAPAPARAAATIVIINADGAGEGFNDPTPVVAVGGNLGTTLGQQRLNVIQAAANTWGARLNSPVTIQVLANFDALSCTATSAVLGSAGARVVDRDFPGAPIPGTWYGDALADALAGVDLVPGEPEIQARFNSNLGQTGCLTGVFFYLGLDDNHGTQIDLLTVVLHELAHGLGFQTFTSVSSGAYLVGLPTVFDHFLFDQSTNQLWSEMTNAARVASAINTRRVSWSGANVTSAVPLVLTPGTPELEVTAPSGIAGSYLVGTASFGPPLASGPFAGELMPVVDPLATGAACNPLTGANALAVNGRMALIDGDDVCSFTAKVRNAQNAGATGVIIVNNLPGSPPPVLAGVDPRVVIPAVSVTQADGLLLKNALRFRSRTRSGVMVSLQVDVSVRQGADALDRMLMFTPNPIQVGSSISHWDTSAFRNLLMEPNINEDLTHALAPPQDLTHTALVDLGWNPCERAELTVLATLWWQDTGIDVSVGQTVTISASGTWGDSAGDVGPEGRASQPVIGPPDIVPLSGEPVMLLVGRIGENGTPFRVGTGTSFTANSSGRLWLVPNDRRDILWDNHGLLSVTVAIGDCQ